MKDFATAFPNTLGTFPATTAKNATSQDLADGTPLLADIYNDWWGFAQAALDTAGFTPSDVAETYDDSQMLRALQYLLSPPGTVVAGLWNTDPAVLGYRLIMLEGQVVLVADYQDLVNATWLNDLTANNTRNALYRCTNPDGSGRSLTGDYYKLPDARGIFLRGEDTGELWDPYGNRYLGELSLSRLQKHKHYVVCSNHSVGSPNVPIAGFYDTSVGGTTLITEGGASFPESSTRLLANNITTFNPDSEVVLTNDKETAPTNMNFKIAMRY